MRLLDRLFRHEEINGHDLCPTYMHRWTLLRFWGGAALYLHKFVDDDWSRDMHDHPKRFISVGLRGRYIEHSRSTRYRSDGHREEYDAVREYRAPWVRSFPATHTHRICLYPDRRPCWTLVLVLQTQRRWGFWPGGRWVFWRDYVGSDAAKAAKVCD